MLRGRLWHGLPAGDLCSRLALRTALLVVGGALAAPRVGLSASYAPQSPEWTIEVSETLGLYRAGDYLSVQQISTELLASSRDPRVRRDAAALYALTLLRMPARSDRLDGRTRLVQLGREDPALLDRPECSLALGVAHVELAETARALEYLDNAAEGFAARKEYDRLAEALAALAEGWLRHTEWEVTPPRFGVPRPQTIEQARQIRREQVARVRERLSAVPNNDDALARVDLILAEDFIAGGDRVADGLRILEQLAAAPQMTPAGAAATLKLAQRFEQQQRWPEVLALYRRLAAEGEAETACDAERRIAAITAPRLMLTVPPRVRSGQPIRVRLQVRNVDAVQVEVRRVELGAWLEARRGRFAEALLPSAGSVQLVRRLATRTGQEYDWWQSDALQEPLEFGAPPGAYVLIASRGVDRPNPLTTKRLVIVSDLTATVFVGPQQALIWATSSKTPDAATPTARFWMYGSYVPTKPRFAAGIARFTLPPESRVMRDKRWVCLVEAGEHLALCRGELARRDATPTAPAVALVGGPPRPKVGQTLTLAGLVLPARRTGVHSAEPEWQLEVRDVLDRLVLALPLEVSAAGIFAARVPITEELSDKHLRLVLRRDNAVVENVRGRFGVQVGPAAACDILVACRVPPLIDSGTPEIVGSIRAWYPWGTPLSNAVVSCVLREVSLPRPENDYRLVPAAALVVADLSHNRDHDPGHRHDHGHRQTDEAGQFAFGVPAGSLTFPEGPTALGVWAYVFGWERLQVVGRAESLRAAQPVHAWLRYEPSAPRAGQDVRFELGWYDPTGRTGIEQPRLEICRDGRPLVQLALYPDVEGLKSEPWRPAAGGTFEAAASLPRMDGEALRVSRTVVVDPAASSADAHLSRPRCTAQFAEYDGRSGVLVRLEGRLTRPLVVVVEADDPLAAHTLDGLDEVAEVFLPLDAAPAGARVVVVAASQAGVEAVAREQVKPAAAQAIELQIEPPDAPLLPGMRAPVRVACTRAGASATGATLLARLVPAADSGHIHWQPGETRRAMRPAPGGPTWVSSDAPGGLTDAEQALGGPTAEAPLSPPLVRALFEGATLWATALPVADGPTEFDVPLPDAPGLYRLMVFARTAHGALATDALLLDTRAGIRVSAEVPANLSLGDRTLASILLENSRRVPVAVRVRLDPGDGLHVESLRVGENTLTAGAAQLAAPHALVVPAAGRAWVQARVEAVQVGAGEFHAELELAGGRQRATAMYQVLRVDQPKGDGAALRLRRTLILATEEKAQVDPDTGEFSDEGMWKTVAQHTPLTSGSRILPGQYLLVREEFRLAEPLAALTWSQRIPPNCHAVQSGSRADETVGELQSRGLNALRFIAPSLAAGYYTHEYEVVAVRPGVCLLPLPEVAADGDALTVIVEPAELLVNVVGSP